MTRMCLFINSICFVVNAGAFMQTGDTWALFWAGIGIIGIVSSIRQMEAERE